MWKSLYTVFFSMLLCSFVAQPGTENYKVFYYENGQVSSEGNLVDGKPDGWWKTYYENGELKSIGKRSNFELDSLWTFYSEDGVLESKITYQSGRKEGEELFYDDEGKLQEKYVYVDGLKQGEAFYFYSTGEVSRIIPFVDDKEKGKGYEFAKDGRIITKTKYDQGYLRSIEKINRYDQQKRKKGYWEELWDNGQVKEEGNFTLNQRNGIFKFYDRKGKLEKMITYKNGEEVTEEEQASVILDIKRTYHDSGAIKMIGSYDGDDKQGVFREYDEDGNITNAVIYKDNIKSGEGVVDSEGMRQGPWVLFFPSGEIMAEGEYVNNQKEGKWKYFYKTGKTRQTGSYRLGLPHGEWFWYYQNGQSWREEIYRKGKEDGLMVEYDSIGNIIHSGEYIDGLKNGMWFYHVNDHKEEGEYIEGEKHGKWKFTYDNGRKNFEGEYLGGIPVGKHVWYYGNGLKKLEGKYQDGEKQGDWKQYNELGEVKNIIRYDMGIAVKVNGQKVSQEEVE